MSRWLGQLGGYRTRDIPGLDWLAGWLEANRPPGQPPAVMHGDYSPYNVMASPRDTRRLAAVVDWDTGTIGDPLLDVGHLLARWTEPGEEPAIGVWDIEVRDGLPYPGRTRRPVRPTGPAPTFPRCRITRRWRYSSWPSSWRARWRGGAPGPLRRPPNGPRWWTGSSATPGCSPARNGLRRGRWPDDRTSGQHHRRNVGLDGRVAVVTGGSRGIGRAIAAGFAEAGADVVIASRKLGNCTAAAAEISEKTGRTTLGVSPRRALGGLRPADRGRVRRVRPVRRAGQQRGDVAALPGPGLGHRGVLRQGPGGQPEGAVPARGPGGHPDGAGRGRQHHQHQLDRLAAAGPDELVYACAKAGLNALTVGLADALARGSGSTRSCPARCSPTSPRPGRRRDCAGPANQCPWAGRASPQPGRDRAVAGQPRVGVGDRSHGAGRRRPVPADQLTSCRGVDTGRTRTATSRFENFRKMTT